MSLVQPSAAPRVGSLQDGPGAPSIADAGEFIRVKSDGTALEFAPVSIRSIVPLVSGTCATDFTQGVLQLGDLSFSTADYPTGCSFYFAVVLQCSDAGVTARARLWNVTDDELVTDTESTHTGDTSATLVLSAQLTQGAAAGNLQDTTHMYAVRLDVSAGGADATDVATMTQAYLLVIRA
jgi:hypothetical protein